MDKVEELAEIMVELASVDDLRYEALLHAWPPGPNEISEHSEAALNQVGIEIAEGELPTDEHQLDELRGRLIETAERWALECIADRHVKVELRDA